MHLGQLIFRDESSCHMAGLHRISEADAIRGEKNWTPQVVDNDLRFIKFYQDSVVFSAEGKPLSHAPSALALDHIRGGSQAISFAGGWLRASATLQHEIDGHVCYRHRFA
jgi:hypothetical protein